VEGAEGGTSWNERRDGGSELGSILFSEVQRSTEEIADPGTSPTAGIYALNGRIYLPECPKKRKK